MENYNNSNNDYESGKIPDFVCKAKYYTYQKNCCDDNPNIDNKCDEKLCRVCYDDSDESKLINPCKCGGSIKWIHEECLKKWVNTSKKDICPQCKYKYKTKVEYRYPRLEFMTNKIAIKCTTVVLLLATISLLALLSFYFKKDIGSSFIFSKKTIFSNFYHFYNGLKIFLIFSVVLLSTLHIRKTIDILEIINNNSLNIGTNLIEFSFCIFVIYYHLITLSINKILNKNITYLNYTDN